MDERWNELDLMFKKGLLLVAPNKKRFNKTITNKRISYIIFAIFTSVSVAVAMSVSYWIFILSFIFIGCFGIDVNNVKIIKRTYYVHLKRWLILVEEMPYLIEKNLERLLFTDIVDYLVWHLNLPLEESEHEQ